MSRSPEEHAIEECAELIELLAQIQFAILRKKRGWKARVRKLMDHADEEWGDVTKTIDRLNIN